MKRILFLLGWSLCLTISLSAQDESSQKDLDYPTDWNQENGNYHTYYTDRSDIFTNMTSLELDLKSILFDDVIQIRSGVLNASVTKRERLNRNNGVMSFFGTVDGFPESSVQMTVNDGFLHAYISIASDLYRIETLDGQNYIFKVDQSHVPKEGCFDIDDSVDPSAQPGEEEPIETTGSSQSRINYTCKIRVLVMYTTAYGNATADPRGSIQGYMDYSNDANNLSGVAEDLELCYVEQTNYTETSSMYTDRNRFRNDNDGFMDEVHDLRFIYEADLCHLMTNRSGHTGVAYTIDADNSSDAFCLTNKGNAESIFTFAHEMGHLLGCRHDTYVDGSSNPYAFGHGYIRRNLGANNFRTLMAYGTECTDNGTSCPRVLRWSNPSITYNGVAAGTVSTNDNERVWDLESNEVLGFNQADLTEIIDDADVSLADYGYVTARDVITTSGNLTIEGTDFDMIATNKITLGNGFKVANGTKLFMDTQAVGTCP